MKRITPYLRMKVMGAIEFAEGNSIRDRLHKVSEMYFKDEEGFSRKFTWRTIETWRTRFNQKGLPGIQINTRGDKGQTRKMAPGELSEAIQQVLPMFRKQDKGYNKKEIYRTCLEKGILRKEQIAQTTFYRFIQKYELMKPHLTDGNPHRLAYSKAFANEMWQADTMFGPYVKEGENSFQAKMIAFIDDASRVMAHGEFFKEENTVSFVKAFKTALYKRGVPQQLYVDNGAIYSNQEITLICARLGILLSHTPVRDGAAKGKIERFNRTVRDGFLCRELDLSSLEKLNKQFSLWCEEEYNARVHSGIGMKPIDRFGMDLKRIHFLPPSEFNDELFYAEDTRQVKKDNTFSFANRRYETPTDLRGREIVIRFDRSKNDSPVVYYKGERQGKANLLNLIANDRHPRNEVQL